jgi:hypothetical protein
MDVPDPSPVSHVSVVSRVKETMGAADVSLVTHGPPFYAYPIISATKR